MTMDVNRSLKAFVGDTQARGRRRSPLLELYTQSIFAKGRKNQLRASAACGGRPRLGCGIDGEKI
jgi:hypothetical protein